MHVRLTLAACLVLAPLAVAGPARAAEGWNEYALSGLPAAVIAPTAFTIVVDGPDAVCRMAFEGVECRSAPWAFTYDPFGDNRDTTVDIHLCDGRSDWTYVNPYVPFTFDRTVVTGSYGPKATFTVTNHSADPATATLVDASGRLVASVPVTGTTDVSIPSVSVRHTSRFVLAVQGADGTMMSTPVMVTKGWSVFDSYRGTPVGHYAACSTIPWAYEADGQPAQAARMPADIRAALALLSRITGLRFVESASVTPPGIAFRWKDLSGTGIAAYASEDRSVTIGSTWDGIYDRYSGFARAADGMPGRAWLVIHEVMHVLGFDHVRPRGEVMSSADDFGPGDLEGLRMTYPSAGCPAA